MYSVLNEEPDGGSSRIDTSRPQRGGECCVHRVAQTIDPERDARVRLPTGQELAMTSHRSFVAGQSVGLGGARS
jgi:hypothetical protein